MAIVPPWLALAIELLYVIDPAGKYPLIQPLSIGLSVLYCTYTGMSRALSAIQHLSIGFLVLYSTYTGMFRALSAIQLLCMGFLVLYRTYIYSTYL